MEDLLEQLAKEAQSAKHHVINQKCLEAKGVLESRASLRQCPASKLRLICLQAFKNALETNQQKIISLSISGFLKMLRDNQFYGNSGDDYYNEENSLPYQVIVALESLPQHSEDVQIELLKVILGMTCVPNLNLSGQLVTRILEICGTAFGRGSSSMQSASIHAAVQSIMIFVNDLKCITLDQNDHDKRLKLGADDSSEVDQDDLYDLRAPVYDEVVPVINFIAEKLTEAHKHREDKKSLEIPSLFLLECSNSLLINIVNVSNSARKKGATLPPYYSTLFVSSLWQRLCPALIALLGSPVSMRVNRGSGRAHGQMGRGSAVSSHPKLLFSSQEAKSIFSVACNLVVVTGSVGEMRPVLESLFHRMLLYPPPQCRHEALKAVANLLASPEKLLKLAGPILHADPRNPYQCDLALFRIILDSLIECSNCVDSALQMIIIDCVTGLLSSLEIICEGKIIPDHIIKVMNETYPKLENVDYSGPVTYESQLKLPKFEYTEGDSSGNCSDEHESSVSDASPDLEQEGGLRASSQKIKSKASAKDSDVGFPVKDDGDSVSSGDTEGPEDGLEEELCESEQHRLEVEEDSRLQKLSENLGSSTNLRSAKETERERDCANARHFTSILCALLPSLLTIRSTIEVDQAVQEFSSKYCQGVFNQSSEEEGSSRIIINADGIYLATYAALSLNLKLIHINFYCQSETTVTLTQEQFVESVFASGVLVYLSTSWVGEVYCQVLKDSFLQRGGYNPHSPYNCALINLLTDLDGLGSIEQGSQMISDYRRLARASLNIPVNDATVASQKLSRRIVTCSWESVVSILGAVLLFLEERGNLLAPVRLLLLGENTRREEGKKAQDMLILCLNSLQATARLANILGLQKRCGIVFSLLSSACLPKEDKSFLHTTRSKALSSVPFPKKLLKLHRAHILSFNVMMSSGLELGSHASDCWRHLFRCCIYLSELERKYFSSAQKSSSLIRPAAGSQISSQSELFSASFDFGSEEIISGLPKQGANEAAELTVDELLAEFEDDVNAAGYLSPQLSGKALCILTLHVDRFFDNAANQLNLSALESFLKALCSASQAQLFNRSDKNTPKRKIFAWPRKRKSSLGEGGSPTSDELVKDALLLYRLGEVVLKVVRSGRPLVHIMKVWAVAGPHFLEAACHKDGSVSKKAISCIHDVVNSLLGNQIELSHFHFNEALFKPFENLLCLELCDIEVQDQIVSSLCEFVESCNSEIRSGWRPLFGALSSVRVPHITKSEGTRGICTETISHLRVVRDVFDAFLNTDNVLVFSNAALDCILCLLKHVKGTDEEDASETVVCWGELVGGDLCLDALKYLHRCAAILASMFTMPACPVFHAAQRISLDFLPNLVDCHLPGVDETNLWQLIDDTIRYDYQKVSYECLWPRSTQAAGVTLIQMDGGSGLLQVWYILLEGLVGAAITCPRRHQPQVVETLFGLMRSLPDCPGTNFGMYCINHLLLPFMQEWLRKSTTSQRVNWDATQPFKQYVGLTCELVVEYLRRSNKAGTVSGDSVDRLMLQQCLIVLVECTSFPSEAIARLGCSCIKHISVSCGTFLPSELWEVIVCAVHRASQVSLYPLYQLMHLFRPDSSSFYGDIGHVKVAARRDCTGYDSDRLRQLSHQVFLLDSQRNPLSFDNSPEAEDRSFIFLLYPDKKAPPLSPNEGGEGERTDPTRVPFRSLVVGLLANQMILQTLGLLLVQGSPHVVPSLANVLLQSSDFSASTDDGVEEMNGVTPGLLKHMTLQQILLLLDSLNLTFNACVEFDRRPGLKFLVQKVAQSDKAANLYKQAGASWTLRMLTLFDLTLSRVKHGLDLADVKSVLEIEAKKRCTLKYVSETAADSVKPQKPSKFLNDDTSLYISKLCDSFTDLCDTYLDLVKNHIENVSIIDQINDKPIFFLTIPMDEFPTEYGKNVEKWTKGLEEFNKDYMKPRFRDSAAEEDNAKNDHDDKRDLSCSSSLPNKMTLGAGLSFDQQDTEEGQEKAASDSDREIRGNRSPSSDGEKKTFTFADLAQSYSSDSEDLSLETKEGDSGVDSFLGVDQSVYTIATEKDIDHLMTNYRRQKNYHSLPSQRRDKRHNPFTDTQHQTSPSKDEAVPVEVDRERSGSLMKDSEAHLKVWTEMVITVFDLISQLKDNELRPILPVMFPTMRSLTAHAHDAHLRQIVAEMFTRVACLYGFSPTE